MNKRMKNIINRNNIKNISVCIMCIVQQSTYKFSFKKPKSDTRIKLSILLQSTKNCSFKTKKSEY